VGRNPKRGRRYKSRAKQDQTKRRKYPPKTLLGIVSITSRKYYNSVPLLHLPETIL
jgi:hypothetical protein